MNEWYFYQDEGKTLGPFSPDDIRARLRDGRLRVFDLLFRDGDTKWRLALEHAAFAKEFRTGGVTALKSRPWVCLQRKAPNSQEFLTSGPYSTDEIRSRLQSGIIGYGDYAWKDGFSDWKRLGSLEEFNRRARGQNLPPVPSSSGPATEELLKDVVEFKRPNLIETVEAPKEAVTKNLAEELSIAPKPIEAALSQPEPELPPTPATPPARPQPKAANPQKEMQRQRRLVDVAIPFALLLVLFGVIFAVSRVMTSRSAKMPIVDPQVEAEPPSKNEVAPELPPLKKAEPPVAKEKPAPPPKPSHPPTELTFSLPGANARVGKIDIRSDASSDFQYQIQIVGLVGQVSEGPAFYKFLKMPATGSIKEPLDLSGVKIPLGRFVLHVEIGEMKKDAKFSNGTAESGFKGQLVRQRKLFSSPIFKERIQLFKIAGSLQKQLGATKGRLSAHGLEALKGFKPSAGANYLLFQDWTELLEILKEAQTSVTPELMGRIEKERERLATFSVWR